MIEVKNLTQTYPSGKGIFNVDFSVSEGEVFGYLGPNGAGKTTTIRNLLGFANANQGGCTIEGKDTRKSSAELQHIIGYLPGEMALFDHMTGKEFLKFMTQMRQTKDVKRMAELVERFELETDGKIKKMSKGMKQKVGIITAFMHDPKVYILDEPTSGLDPLMQNLFMDLIEEEKQRGKTILMSSHIFEEVRRSCDTAGIIREGRLVAVEDVKSLGGMKSKTHIVTFGSQKDVDQVLSRGMEGRLINDHRVEFSIQYPFGEFYKMLGERDVINMEIKQESLEDVFMKYYGEEGVGHE